MAELKQKSVCFRVSPWTDEDTNKSYVNKFSAFIDTKKDEWGDDINWGVRNTGEFCIDAERIIRLRNWKTRLADEMNCTSVTHVSRPSPVLRNWAMEMYDPIAGIIHPSSIFHSVGERMQPQHIKWKRNYKKELHEFYPLVPIIQTSRHYYKFLYQMLFHL